MYSQQSYGERCCNYPNERASRERCEKCKYVQQALRTFSQCQVDWDEIQKNKKIMEETKEKDKVIYAKWVPMTKGTYVNGVKTWDHRWWANIFCKINWFFHFKLRKRHKELENRKINSSFYGTINYTGNNEEAS